jgi:Ulp1 family protease
VRREKKNSADILPLVRKDVRRLDDKQWYGDSIMQFCLTKACEVALSEGHSLISQWNLGKAGDDFSVLSSFLIPRVISSKNGIELPSVTGWIIGGNNSLCEFLLFPINLDNLHWSLGIVWLAPAQGSIRWKRCILYLDSLSLSSSSDLSLSLKFHKQVEAKCVAIRTYLNSLSSVVNTSHNLPVIHVKVPQQTNGYDCGLMVLHYAILFIMCNNKRALAIDLIAGKKENWFGVPHDQVSGFVLQLRNSVREAVLKLLIDR